MAAHSTILAWRILSINLLVCEMSAIVRKFEHSLALPFVALVVSDFVRPHGRQPTRLPCPWDSPGKNTGVGCHFLLQSDIYLDKMCLSPKVIKVQGRGTGPFRIIPSVQNSLSGCVC